MSAKPPQRSKLRWIGIIALFSIGLILLVPAGLAIAVLAGVVSLADLDAYEIMTLIFAVACLPAGSFFVYAGLKNCGLI
jgi:hypothetical protein